MRILVLGKSGMLGHVVYTHFKDKGYDVYGTNPFQNDGIYYDAFNDQEAIEKIISDIKPDAVVNCIGILNQVCEANKPLAIKLNSLLPHYMDALSEKYNFKFVHVSTDCVFEGDRGKYDETAFADATSFYGRSKALGEVKNSRSVTLRTSIVGPDENPNGIGLFQWFMNQKDTVGGYTKVIWTGVTTIELAKQIEVALENNLCGLNHVVNNDFISKHDLITLFKESFNKAISITENDSVVSEKTLVRTNASFAFEIPSYKEMVEEMKQWVIKHKELYPNIVVEEK